MKMKLNHKRKRQKNLNSLTNF